MNKTNKKITGFTETLKTITKTPNINTNVCLPIYMNGMNSNKINFFQSEFPNLTKIKPLIRLNQNSLNQNSVKIDKKVKNKVKNKSDKKVNFGIPNKINTKKKSLVLPCPQKQILKLKQKKLTLLYRTR
jgi:hypothetical protein